MHCITRDNRQTLLPTLLEELWAMLEATSMARPAAAADFKAKVRQIVWNRMEAT